MARRTHLDFRIDQARRTITISTTCVDLDISYVDGVADT